MGVETLSYDSRFDDKIFQMGSQSSGNLLDYDILISLFDKDNQVILKSNGW